MTNEEQKAYQAGYAAAEAVQKQYPGSIVVVFEEHVGSEDRAGMLTAIRYLRGVADTLPVAETHAGHREWRDIVEALGCDPSDDHAHNAALANAREAATSLTSAKKAWDAFWKMAMPEQRQTIIDEVYPHLRR